MAYTTIKKPSDYFNTITYTGDGSSSRSLTGVNFQPDFIWGKSRSAVRNHHLFDGVRGGNKLLKSNSTDAETVDPGSGDIGSFDSDGFTAISGSSDNNNFNNNSESYVAWNWLANGAGSANTDGSISSTVSASATSGFSIVSYTGTGSNATVGHGLNSPVTMIIVKNRDRASPWWVTNTSLGFTKQVRLNDTNASQTEISIFNDTAPTSSVFTVGTNSGSNQSGENHIAYCFADVQGYSKFGSYTGNGSTDGTFVYTGFKPAFVIIKNSSSVQNWVMFDSKRPGFNVTNDIIYPNQSDAEANDDSLDLLSNGFKIRSSGNDRNGSGNTLIYMAFAEEPLVGDNPATAR